MVNEHNAWVPQEFWVEHWERAAIVAYYKDHPDEGYRQLTYMMMDADIVAVSPSSAESFKAQDFFGAGTASHR